VKAAVLMSTYNGEKYIVEQIESIFRQKNIDIELYIRDDGSKDNTLNIIGQYDKIHLFKGENIGVGNSFMELVYSVSDGYDYYAFSDQDDIWDDMKLFEAVAMLNKTGKHLYGSNQMLVDKTGKELGLRYQIGKDINIDTNAILNQNHVSGCTMVFDNYLKRILSEKRPSRELLENRIHDVWVAMVSSLTGGMVYDGRSFIKYRQHDDNVVGAYSGGFAQDIKIKIKKILDKSQRNGRSILAREIVRLFGDECKDNKLINASADAKKFNNKLWLLRNMNKVLEYSGETRIGLGLKVIFNFY
jgi:rhamnosyltransferase